MQEIKSLAEFFKVDVVDKSLSGSYVVDLKRV
jgi:hypothetical protein